MNARTNNDIPIVFINYEASNNGWIARNLYGRNGTIVSTDFVKAASPDEAKFIYAKEDQILLESSKRKLEIIEEQEKYNLQRKREANQYDLSQKREDERYRISQIKESQEYEKNRQRKIREQTESIFLDEARKKISKNADAYDGNNWGQFVNQQKRQFGL